MRKPATDAKIKCKSFCQSVNGGVASHQFAVFKILNRVTAELSESSSWVIRSLKQYHAIYSQMEINRCFIHLVRRML